MNCQCTKQCEFPCWQRVGIAPLCGICGCKQQAAYDELHHGPTTVGKRDDDAAHPASSGAGARSPSADRPARELIDCPYCHGNGSIDYNPSWNNDPQAETSAPCPTCRGAGTVERRTWDIVVCVLCLEHVNDCHCDLDGWRGDEPPTMRLTVRLDDLTDVVKALRKEAANRGYTEWPLAADFIERELGAAS